MPLPFGSSASSASSARWIMPLIESAMRRLASVVGMLVHHRGAHAVMAHALHQIPQARPALTGQRVAAMAEIMEMQAGAPTAATAADQPTARRKLLRRSDPPRAPVNSGASCG